MIEHMDKHEYDVFKHSNLRYIGYSNEFGEAFRNVVPKKVVYASWVVECLYFFSDVAHKSYLSFYRLETENKKDQFLGVFHSSSHTILWQFFASVTLPALIINRIVKFSKIMVQKRTNNISRIKSIPTFIGLSCIPIMPYVVDPFVDNILDRYFKKESKI